MTDKLNRYCATATVDDEFLYFGVTAWDLTIAARKARDLFPNAATVTVWFTDEPAALAAFEAQRISWQWRRDKMRDCPILRDYLATALQDLDLSESDESCAESREPRDSGTIFDCPDETFLIAWQECKRFMAECAADIESATDLEPGESGLRYGREYMTHERIGSTLYLSRVGHGVSFTDDGDAPCLQALENWCNANRRDSLYFGDDGCAYW